MTKIINEIKISVVCPTYNSEEFITGTLETLIFQKDKPFEVIIVDDGSTDNTLQLLESYRKNFTEINVKYFIFKNKHKGPGHARNTGIVNANGNWISFLDSDDTWSDMKLFKVKEKILSNPEVNFILHWEMLLGKDYSKVLKHGENFKKEENLGRQLFKNNFISTSASTCSKYLLKENLFDEKLPISQDYELWLRMSDSIKISLIKEVLGHYIIREGSITSKAYIKRLFYLIKILIRHRDKSNILNLILRILRAFITKQWINI